MSHKYNPNTDTQCHFQKSSPSTLYSLMKHWICKSGFGFTNTSGLKGQNMHSGNQKLLVSFMLTAPWRYFKALCKEKNKCFSLMIEPQTASALTLYSMYCSALQCRNFMDCMWICEWALHGLLLWGSVRWHGLNPRSIHIKSVIDRDGATCRNSNWLQTHKDLGLIMVKQESSDKHTDTQTNGRYQTYYLPCFAVDN